MHKSTRERERENGFEFEVRKRWHARRRRCRWFESLETAARLLVKGRARQRARVPANYEADTADKRSESAHAICIPRRETIVPSILWVRKLYEDGDEEMKRMRSNVSTFEKTTLVYVFLYRPSFSVG